MTAVATIEHKAPPRSLLMSMAGRYGMEPAAFEQTLRATVVPPKCSREQFAAFLLVAREYDLNPITKEIYAFPTQGGGIQPIVGVDGWMRIINAQPDLDGIEFEDIFTEGHLSAIRCRIYRRGRSRPTEVIEYMSECRRATTTWKQWPARMLRHKAVIQCARYAYGFSGIAEPDEVERGGLSVPHAGAPAAAQSVSETLAAFASEPEAAKQAEEPSTSSDASEHAIPASSGEELGDIPPELDRRHESAKPGFPSGGAKYSPQDSAAQLKAMQGEIQDVESLAALAEWDSLNTGRIARLVTSHQTIIRNDIGYRMSQLNDAPAEDEMPEDVAQ